MKRKCKSYRAIKSGVIIKQEVEDEIEQSIAEESRIQLSVRSSSRNRGEATLVRSGTKRRREETPSRNTPRKVRCQQGVKSDVERVRQKVGGKKKTGKTRKQNVKKLKSDGDSKSIHSKRSHKVAKVDAISSSQNTLAMVKKDHAVDMPRDIPQLDVLMLNEGKTLRSIIKPCMPSLVSSNAEHKPKKAVKKKRPLAVLKHSLRKKKSQLDSSKKSGTRKQNAKHQKKATVKNNKTKSISSSTDVLFIPRLRIKKEINYDEASDEGLMVTTNDREETPTAMSCERQTRSRRSINQDSVLTTRHGGEQTSELPRIRKVHFQLETVKQPICKKRGRPKKILESESDKSKKKQKSSDDMQEIEQPQSSRKRSKQSEIVRSPKDKCLGKATKSESIKSKCTHPVKKLKDKKMPVMKQRGRQEQSKYKSATKNECSSKSPTLRSEHGKKSSPVLRKHVKSTNVNKKINKRQSNRHKGAKKKVKPQQSSCKSSRSKSSPCEDYSEPIIPQLSIKKELDDDDNQMENEQEFENSLSKPGTSADPTNVRVLYRLTRFHTEEVTSHDSINVQSSSSRLTRFHTRSHDTSVHKSHTSSDAKSEQSSSSEISDHENSTGNVNDVHPLSYRHTSGTNVHNGESSNSEVSENAENPDEISPLMNRDSSEAEAPENNETPEISIIASYIRKCLSFLPWRKS